MGPKFGTQLEELERSILKYQIIAGRSCDADVALTALRNVTMQIKEIIMDVRANSSMYARHIEMKTKLMEYSGALDMEIQLRSRKNNGSSNVLLTPRKKRDGKICKDKVMTMDKGGK